MRSPATVAVASAAVLVALIAALTGLGPSLRSGRDAALEQQLRTLYERQPGFGARWRRRATVRVAGREVPREQAYRDDPRFLDAASRLMASRAGDDAALGAWLLGTARPQDRDAAARRLVGALEHADDDRPLAFEATLGLARLHSPVGASTLARLSASARSEDVRTAAAWASGRIPPRSPGLAASFRRGVSWWLSETGSDDGASSFRRLAALGVRWVSIHTWDPLQRGLHDPVLAAPDRRFAPRDLGALVRSAHQAGLRVMLKPHLELRGIEPSEEERRILRGADEAARQALFRRLQSRLSQAEPLDHGRIEMRSEADWRRWFAAYEEYLLPYARQAQAAGADLFCVGREMDLTVRRREADWRRLIARVRAEYHGPLTYSANFDDWQQLGFWDALDFIGISAYFPLTDRPDPSLAELEDGWERALRPLEAAQRRWQRPVLFTEAGFPSVPGAARAPWKEERASADVWLQARCYEATLRALARRPWIEGAFFWLWERSAPPPFRDPSHAIEDKPAEFTLARWYAQ